MWVTIWLTPGIINAHFFASNWLLCIKCQLIFLLVLTYYMTVIRLNHFVAIITELSFLPKSYEIGPWPVEGSQDFGIQSFSQMLSQQLLHKRSYQLLHFLRWSTDELGSEQQARKWLNMVTGPPKAPTGILKKIDLVIKVFLLKLYLVYNEPK